MARLGTARVADVLDYERDIKGKGLIRLRSGVGSGKNYWVRHLPEQYPNLQILMITSRKNVAQAEAIRLGTDNRIYTSRLIDTKDREWYTDFPGTLMVCTNAYIEYFFKNIYNTENLDTHLWNKFDVFFVDEAHSVTSDASFADSSFHVVQLIRHARERNPQCDVVLMSGTQAPIDWMFADEFFPADYVNIDLYDQCIHLAPDIVSLMKKDVVAERIHRIWSRGKRLIYFANSVSSMAGLIKKLMAYGVPEQDIAVAYTESKNEKHLPLGLVEQKDEVRRYLIENSRLPDYVKIFITTSQNKEGVSIENDDIRYVFSENHNKADLEQMAGRVRGNPDTGTGIHALVVIYDAKDHQSEWSFVECELDRKLVGQVEGVLELHKAAYAQAGEVYDIQKDICAIEKKHRYLRYDYVTEQFCHYVGREKCERQSRRDEQELRSYMDLFDEVLYYCSDTTGREYAVTGRSELRNNWFPDSKVYDAPDWEVGPKESAAIELVNFLQENEYLDVEITPDQEELVMAEIHRLIVVYGRDALGFKNDKPKTLKLALAKFGMTSEAVSHHNRNKVIHLTKEAND